MLCTVNIPNHEEVCWIRFMSEQRCADEVVVQRWNCLPWIDVTEFHERRFVLRLDDNRFPEVILPRCEQQPRPERAQAYLRNMVVLLVLFSVIVHEDATHAEVRDDGRVLLRELP